MADVTLDLSLMKYKMCDTPWSRATGLMFGYGLDAAFFVFDKPGVYPIHSFFVPKTFDAYYLDESFVVVDALYNIPPWKPKFANKTPAKYLFEVYSDVLKANGWEIVKGDKVAFVF